MSSYYYSIAVYKMFISYAIKDLKKGNKMTESVRSSQNYSGCSAWHTNLENNLFFLIAYLQGSVVAKPNKNTTHWGQLTLISNHLVRHPSSTMEKKLGGKIIPHHQKNREIQEHLAG